MKKIMSVLLTVCILLTACVTAFAVDEEITDMGTRIGESDVFWKIDFIKNPENEEEVISTVLKFNGEGSIPDYANDYIANKCVYPWKNLSYDTVEFGEKIVGIGNGALAYSKELKTVVIPETVTVIGEYAFYGCPELESAEIKSPIQTVSPYLFAGCDKLKTVVFPDSAEAIAHHAFYSCPSLGAVAVPEKTASIGEYAFTKCTSLKSVELKEVSKIGKYAFYCCEALETLDLGTGLQQIDSNAFDGCIALTSVAFPEGTQSIASGAFSGCSKLSTVTFPETLKTLGEKAFNICPEIKAVTFGNDVETIGEKSIGYGKRGAKNEGFTVTGYKDSVAEKYATANEFEFISLGYYTHGSCGETAEWSFDLENGVLTISGTGAVKDYSLGELPEYSRFAGKIKSISIGDGIPELGAYAFYNLSVNDMVIPATVEKIGEKAIGNYVDGMIADGFKFSGYYNSAAEKYAQENEIGFTCLTPFMGKCGEDVTWSYDREKFVLTLSGTGATDDFTLEKLPDYSDFEIKNIVVGDGITKIGSYALVLDGDVEKITFGDTITELGETAPFGFKRVFDEAYDVQKCESLTIEGYDETPVKAYAETNEFTYVSLNEPAPPTPVEFPKLVIGTDLKIIIDNENKLIYFYQMNAEKSVLEEDINKEDFDSVTVSADVVATGTTLTLTAGEETQIYTFLVLGDVTGDSVVNSADALAILQHSVESQLLEGNALIVGNLNGDDVINSADALTALQISVGQVELASLMPTK